MAGILSTGQTGKGFVLPDGYSWDAKLIDRKKEGKITVKDEFGCISCVLHFRNDKLNGLCKFYDLGSLVEKRTFVNDVEEGWACEIEMGEEVRWYLYANGKRNAELKKYNNMENYWQAVKIFSNQLISICKYDDNHVPIGKGYIYENGCISRIVMFENGNEKYCLKTFEENKMMTEYDNSGNRVYKGGFIDDISKDYPREGKGMEFVGGVLVYAGEWKNNMRNGKGHTLKNRVAEYQGEWKEGLPNGLGLLNRDGKSYKGNWDMGKLKMDNGETYDYVSGQIIHINPIPKPIPPVKPKPEATIKMVIENKDQLRELLKNDDKKRSVKQLVIAEGIGNEMNDDLELCGFDNLESIVVKKDSLKNLNSLKISDNPLLKSIETEDGEYKKGAFYNVKNVTITSTLIDD